MRHYSILITGANGFIGSRLCEALVQKGHKVTAMARRTSDLSFLKNLDIPLLFSDLSDPILLSMPEKIDYIVHAAGLASDWGPYSRFHKANVLGTINVLKLGLKLRVKRAVILSSLGVMGFGHAGATEETPWSRSDVPYVLSKREMEKEALAFSAEHRLEVVLLRPGDVYGPNDRTTTMRLFAALEAGSMGRIGSGRAKLSPLYIDNLVQACLLGLEEPRAAGQAFNITDGVTITWTEWIAKICRELGIAMPKLNVPFGLAYAAAVAMETVFKILRKTEAPLLTRYRIMHAGEDYDFNIAKAEKLLGYRPSKDIAGNLKTTAGWYRTNRDKKLKVLVTGASGFWGWNICSYLSGLKNGNMEILGTWNSKKTEIAGIKTDRMDLKNRKSVDEAVKGFEPDIIVHTAAVSKVKDCEADKPGAQKVNVDAVRSLVELANLFKARLIFFSTDLVYATSDQLHRESDRLVAELYYERTKIEAEEIIRRECYDYVILRTALSYGPPAPGARSFINELIDALAASRPVNLFTDQFRTPVSTFDGVKVVEKLCASAVRNRTINLGGKEKMSRFEIGMELAKVFGFDKDLIRPLTYRDAKNIYLPSRDTAMDTTELSKIYPGMRPFRTNLRLLKDWYGKHESNS